MPQVILELTANERRLLQAYKESVDADEALRKSVGETGEAGKRAAKKIADGMISASREASKEVKKSFGNMTDEGLREMRDLQKALRAMGPEGRAAARELSRHLATAGREGVDSVDDIIDRIEKIDDAAGQSIRKARADFKSLSKEQEKTVGPKGLEMISKYAAGWLSVAGGIGAIADAMERVRETNARALDSLEGQASGDKRLLQVSTNPEDFKKLRERADALARKEGIGRDEARNLMFSARSEGFEGAAGFIASNAQILDVEAQAGVAGQIPGLFKKEGLTPEQAINMTLAAAQSSRLDFSQVARALPGAAEGGALAGASSDETMASLAVLAGRFKSGETAADRIKAFATRVGMDEGGGGISAEEAAKKQAAEDKRVEEAKRAKRSLVERRDDVARGRDEVARDLEEAKKIIPQTKAEQESKIKRVEALEKRLEDRERDLKRADRAVSEFDSSRLDRKTFSATPGRASLKGKGIVGAVEMLQGMSEEDRKDFLGDSQEVNAAYTILVEELGAIKREIGVAQSAKATTGTTQSVTGQKRIAAASDPKLAAAKKAARGRVAQEIDEENRRATTEAQRVSDRAQAVASAERRGVSGLRVEMAQKAASAAHYVGQGEGFDASMPLLLGDEMALLSHDASQAVGSVEGSAKKKLEAMLVASTSLENRRKKDPNAILSQQDVASYLFGVTGEVTDPTKVSDDQRQFLTRELLNASKDNADQWSVLPSSRKRTVIDESSELAAEMLRALRNIEAATMAGSAAQAETAENTRNGGGDPNSLMQQAASAADSGSK